MDADDSAIDVVVTSTAAPAPSAALSHLFADHYLQLVRLARRLVDDNDTAEDVVQDVFAGLDVTRVADLGAPDRYLRAAVVNRCRSVLRRRRVVRLTSVGHRRPPGTSEAVEPADAPLLLTERRRRVLDAVTHLPGRQREVIVLTYYLDMDIAGVAALLRISPSAASSSLGRALATLTRMLGDDDA
ncbi:RNA polymerase sigma factor [uncultured Jatrophihabitans sp.]|uniref:RNA polymerase sigma factor n=1 Tax=uncultured Jatrophihabitans sp. TaxID=1610747 RepID=UPI0035CBB4F0